MSSRIDPSPVVQPAPTTRSSPRRRARELVLQGLYQCQVAGNSPTDVRANLAEDASFERADPEFFGEMWEGIAPHFATLVGAVGTHVDRPVADLSPIERAILAIGAWELAQQPGTPYRVVINEAVELAKRYGATDGHKFVNGVLDKYAAVVRAPEIEARARERSARPAR
jgi:N utilization substance protein B